MIKLRIVESIICLEFHDRIILSAKTDPIVAPKATMIPNSILILIF